MSRNMNRHVEGKRTLYQRGKCTHCGRLYLLILRCPHGCAKDRGSFCSLQCLVLHNKKNHEKEVTY